MTDDQSVVTAPSPEALASLPVLPLRGTVLFPYLFLPLSAGRPALQTAVEAALASEDKTFLALALRNPEAEPPAGGDLVRKGGQ